MLHIILFLVNLLRFVLWPKIWSVLMKVLYVLEKNAYSAVLHSVVKLLDQNG